MDELRFRAARAEDSGALVDLFSSVYGARWRERTSTWRYIPPTKNKSLIWVGEVNGRIVGAQPSHEIAIQRQGSILKGALLLDVMTHPGHRRRGVFTGVVEGVRAALHAVGLRVLLTTPNGAAARGFATLPAWRRAGELVPLVRPVRWRSLLHAAPDHPDGPRQDTQRSQADELPTVERDPRAGSLWSQFASWSGTCVVRDAGFLAWRYGAHTGRSYRLETRGSHDAWSALAVTTPGRLLKRDVLFLVDLIAADADSPEVEDLLAGATKEAVARGSIAVVAYLAPGSPLIAAFRRAGFRRVPQLLRPRPYAVWVTTDLAPELAAEIARLEGWHMSLADSDLA